jgi:hypothetical protein
VRKTNGLRVPEIPMTKAKKIITEEELAELRQRKPTMPAQRRALGKSGGGSIRIAKPEMTLTGFKHTATTMSRKSKLDMHGIDMPQFVDIASSSRRSRSKHSHVSFDDVANPASEDGSEHTGFQALDPEDLPPVGREIENDSDDDQVEPGQTPANGAVATHATNAQAKLPTGCDPLLLNPRNYSFVPSQWTQVIRPAGRTTIRSEAIKRVIIGVDE